MSGLLSFHALELYLLFTGLPLPKKFGSVGEMVLIFHIPNMQRSEDYNKDRNVTVNFINAAIIRCEVWAVAFELTRW